MSTPYEAPVALLRLALDQAAETCGLRSLQQDDSLLTDVADTVLESAGRFAREVLSPLNGSGDREGAHCDAAGVHTPAGFAEAYQRFCADGWPALNAPEEAGGQGLPLVIAAAATEIWAGANLSFAMCPEVAAGAIEALSHYAPEALRAAYLPRIVSGEWTAAMCLTEPQSGSDLSALRTRAEPDGEAWRLFGRKIFISWGDHDLADNIVHLVLARAPGAPQGTRGISLFLVPKRLAGPGGEYLANDIHAVSLEHKMGIRASPTCVMVLGENEGARGYLVGELHHGLAYMFAMMNHMRLGVGLHSIGIAERALQLARAYAHERVQGRNASGSPCPIIEHADVRRMLLTMKALTHAARCLAYYAAATYDVSQGAPEPNAREAAGRRLGLLTPVVKAWCSDIAVEVASTGVQVHGGAGYMQEVEASQLYRDARIGPIFEGTNYIQAQDLLARRIVRDRAQALEDLLAEIEAAAHALPASPHPLAALRTRLAAECRDLRQAARRIAAAGAEPALVGAVAYHFLHWLGVVAGGWQWALTAQRLLPRYAQDATARALVDTAVFYATHILPRARAHEAAVSAGAQPVESVRPADI